MKVLFIHQNFPGQFLQLAGMLAHDKHNKVVVWSIYKLPVPPSIALRTYTMLRSSVLETHLLLQAQKAKVVDFAASLKQQITLLHTVYRQP